jgi:hypothetical protein
MRGSRNGTVQILLGKLNEGKLIWRLQTRRLEMHAEFGQENLRKEQLGRPRSTWVYNIKIDVK